MEVRLSWLNAWCSANSNYTKQREYAGNWTKPLGAGIQEREWISACVLSLQPEGLLGTLLEAGRRFRKIETGQRAILGAIMGFNIGFCVCLALAILTFADMTRQSLSWSPLILSKLVLDNVLALLGLGLLGFLWLFQFTYFGNGVCLEEAFVRVLPLFFFSTHVLSVYLSAQVLVLAIVLDRIQGLTNPVVYKVHNRCRRCVTVNIVAIASGLVPLFAMCSYVAKNFYVKRWNGVPELAESPPKTWQDIVCYRRIELSSQCGWPHYATALDEGSGEILSSSSDPSYWYLNREGPAGLCPLPREFDPSQDSSATAIAMFALTFLVGVAVAVAATKLALHYRQRISNQVHVIHNNPAAQAIADSEELHENTVTTTIIFEAINVVLATAFNFLNYSYLVFMITKSREGYVSLANSALVRVFAVMSAQTLLGSYPITYTVFRSFRKTLLKLPCLVWVPKPKALMVFLLFYLLNFSLASIFAVIFAQV